jgi:hypothetical protein
MSLLSKVKTLEKTMVMNLTFKARATIYVTQNRNDTTHENGNDL